jgi:hypothetical protein
MSSERPRSRRSFMEESLRRYPGLTKSSVEWAIRQRFVVPERRQGGYYAFTEKQFLQMREYYITRSRNFLIS